MWYLILKLHHPRLTSPPSEQGFSMIEVLVSIMVTAAFLMGTLQAMFINAIFQVRAEREAQATFWIQEDMEKIKAVAEMSPFDGSYCKDGNNNDCVHQSSQSRYYDPVRDIYYNYPPYPSLQHTLMCRSRNFATGYGGQLRNYLGTGSTGLSLSGGTADIQIAAEKSLVNKNYRLVRIVEGTASSYTEANKTPHVLRITYKVGEPDNTTTDKLKADNGQGFSETLAQVYTEVIPSGTFKCS